MALSNAQTVAVQLEKVRRKLPLLYERADTFFSLIHKRGDVEKVSTRTCRIPLQTNPGGAFGYAEKVEMGIFVNDFGHVVVILRTSTINVEIRKY